MVSNIVNEKNRQIVLIIFLIILSTAVYLNTYRNQFAFDDDPVLVGGHRFRDVSSAASIFTHDFWLIPDTNLYRPLPLLSFAINYWLFGRSPVSYHVINQMLHTLNVLLLFAFLGNFYRERSSIRFLAAALFAVHPAATEAVNLVIGRADLMAFTFSILSLHLYIQRAKAPSYLPGAVLLYACAMLSKENSMILPLFLLLYHHYFDRIPVRTLIRNVLGFGLAAVLVAGIRYAVLGSFGPQASMQFFRGIPWIPTALTMAKGIAYYWKIAFWPTDLQVNYDFNDFPVAYSLFDDGVLLSIATGLFMLTISYWLFRRDRAASYFMLWPFIAFLPVSNVLVPTGLLIAVRLMYLPLAGFSVVLATLLSMTKPLIEKTVHARRDAWSSFLTAGAAGVVLALFFTLTFIRNAEWKDTGSLFRAELQRSPNSVMAMRFLAPVLPLEDRHALLTRAVALSPIDPIPLSLLGEVYENLGDHATAEALQRRSLVMEPTMQAHRQLGIVLSRTGRLDEAEEHFRMAIALRPSLAATYEDLAIVYFKKGDRNSALQMVRQALRYNPDSSSAHNLLGTYYKEVGKYEDAVTEFSKAIALSHNNFEARYNMADAYEKLDPSKAIQSWNDYIAAAESMVSESAWIKYARARIDHLSRAEQGK